VTAHLDSVNHENPSGAAPGADDNASGAAGVLEIVRCLAGHDHAQNLRFILFGGEEQGLFGSSAYVAGLGSGHGVRTAVNMDMIATINATTGPTVLIEGGPISQTLIDNLAVAAETYTGLAVQTSLHFANSDHVPFITAGIPAVLLIEGNDSANTHVHTARDTVDRLNIDLMAEIVRTHLAFLVDAAGVSAS
jgi:Zn-dependent M28 family amino/carboxypeptidase